mgnify:CR=1 FL=1
MLPITKLTIILSVSLLLSGCFVTKPQGSKDTAQKTTTKRYKLAQDTAPHADEPIPDIHNIPNAIPKPEPKSKYGNPKTYTVLKKSYTVLPSSKGYKARGKASWYGKKFHGYRTSNGETYDMYSMSAAHKTLPLPTYAKVTNLDNGKSVIVKINDRGPFHEERIIDLSYAAATKLGILGKGTGNVEIHAIDHEVQIPQRYLQVGVFKQEDNAKQMVLKLKQIAKGHLVEVKPKTTKKSKLYHVHIGPISDDSLITALTDKLIANNFPAPIVILP